MQPVSALQRHDEGLGQSNQDGHPPINTRHSAAAGHRFNHDQNTVRAQITLFCSSLLGGGLAQMKAGSRLTMQRSIIGLTPFSPINLTALFDVVNQHLALFDRCLQAPHNTLENPGCCKKTLGRYTHAQRNGPRRVER